MSSFEKKKKNSFLEILNSSQETTNSTRLYTGEKRRHCCLLGEWSKSKADQRGWSKFVAKQHRSNRHRNFNLIPLFQFSFNMSRLFSLFPSYQVISVIFKIQSSKQSKKESLILRQKGIVLNQVATFLRQSMLNLSNEFCML